MLAESLVRRLPGLPDIASHLLQRAVEGDPSPRPEGGAFQTITAIDGLQARARFAGWLKNPGAGAGSLAALADGGEPPLRDARATKALQVEADDVISYLRPAVHREWVLHCSSAAERNLLLAGGRPCCAENRLYVQQDEDQMRLATVLVSAED